ncbi:STAS/SEC14 domain-containing protein [Nitrosospira lacus]|uniref:STAS/SEC14 domain-containing protein n=1 Tax=Nitrosospira lacus TaxID=1288494 RepID=A0A1W6SSN4_9PROT|nr:STAS/SEC14 domain-containing protein [Nitrosospira lacus]ARO88811.1 STAS/SEC14 domain-containing protein [Nitrosospira lacus]
MMRLLTNLPDHIVGVSASGQIDAKDYETVLIPAIDAALRKHKRIRVLYQLTTDFEGFTTGAMWDDAKLGLAHLLAWERIAVVTDVHWVANATRMFAFLLPGLVKVFSNEEQSDAEKWIAA